MKKTILSILIGAGVLFAGVAVAATLYSYQIGATPTTGYVLQTNGTTSTWVATSSLGFSGGSSSTVNLTGSSTAFYFPYWINTNGGLSTSSPIFVSSSTGGLGFGTTTIPSGYYFNEVASDTNGNYFDLQNNNASSYSEFGLTANNGSTSTFYGGLGINNSAGAKGIENNDDIFLEATNGINYESCVTGTTSNCLHSFFIGGTAAGNLKFKISSTSITANVTTTFSSINISNVTSSILATDANGNVIATTTSGGGSSVGSVGAIQIASSTAGSFSSISTIIATGTSANPEVIVGNNKIIIQTSTLTISYNTNIIPFIVPSGVTSINIAAEGSAGGTPPSGGAGGSGGVANGTLAVTAGNTYYIGFISGGVAGSGTLSNGGYAAYISATSSAFNAVTGLSSLIMVAPGGGAGGSMGNTTYGGGGGGAGFGGGAGGGQNPGSSPGCNGGSLGNGTGGNGAGASSCTNGTGGAAGGGGGSGSSSGNGGAGTNGNGTVNGNGGNGGGTGGAGGTGASSGTNTAGGGGGGGGYTSGTGSAGGSNGGGAGGNANNSNGLGGGGAGSFFVTSTLSFVSTSYSNTATSTAGTYVVISYNGNSSAPSQSYGLSLQGNVIYTSSSSPTLSSCGTGSVVSGGGNERGAVFVGVGSPTACTLTFTTSFDNVDCQNPVVIGATSSSTASGWVSAETGSSVTFGFNTSPAKFGYSCDGY